MPALAIASWLRGAVFLQRRVGRIRIVGFRQWRLRAVQVRLAAHDPLAVSKTPQSGRRRHFRMVRKRDKQQGLHRRRAAKRRSKNNNIDFARAV
ncbi:MAG: hypothetical protein ACTHNO_04215 [Ralstonia sp.]|uniref:Uncharacterized protein n=1 Tax=Ralstonia chuxiongensis TaxID=2957504 RepID=A0AA41WWP2_9RALS|nr:MULTISPECIES: hypothetical protein [Ralstonia]MCP1174682.1 hypothetical protein [Ralstonia chuxiongensis]HWV04694.1 hypothetical protein [Ralstonia sp.]